MSQAYRWLFLFFLRVSFSFATDILPDLTIEIPMRDGVLLPADVYLPSPQARHLPCVLIRNPAGRKDPAWLPYISLAKEDYVVVLQDARSAVDSSGKTVPFFDDGWGTLRDGYDTLAWLAKHPLTNGKIGTIGFSAAGITQLFLAPFAPPSLKCQYIGFAASDLYHQAIFPGGQLLKNQVEGWLGAYAKDPRVLAYVKSQPCYNAFWESFNSLPLAPETKVPGLLYTGWFDTFLTGTIDAFVARQKEGGIGAKGAQKLLIGPWTHHWPRVSSIGPFPVPQNGYEPPYNMSPSRWFAHYLKEENNDVEELPAVTYYVMGPFDGSPSSGNLWRSAKSWPIPTTPLSLYLAPAESLTKTLPSQDEIFSYVHNPFAPLPSLGGNNLFLSSGPADQRSIERRKDLALFTSSPLLEDLEIAGSPRALLYFSSPSPDTDVIIRLSDVYPDGKSLLISEGIYRTGSKNCKASSSLTSHKEEAQKLEISLTPTAIVFAKGHRIRLAISGSSYPKYEINFGSSEGKEGAELALIPHRIYSGKTYPSCLLLPVFRAERLPLRAAQKPIS